MKIKSQNHQTLLNLSAQTINHLLNWFMMQALDPVPQRTFHTVSLHLVDDQRMTAVNRSVFNRNTPTDVIALTYDPIPGEDPELEGEIFVNVERAMQMQNNPLPLEQELALYMAHGCDHLAGSDDDTDERKAAMLATNQAWVQAAAEQGFLDKLVDAS